MTPKKLKKLRKNLEICQSELSIASGVSRFNISAYECGYIELKPRELAQIEGVLNDLKNSEKQSKQAT